MEYLGPGSCRYRVNSGQRRAYKRNTAGANHRLIAEIRPRIDSPRSSLRTENRYKIDCRDILKTLTLTRPDDCHLHLRDGEHLRAVLPDSARRFARAIIMPNLKPPVVTAAMALAYRERIFAALPQGMRFEPLMTLYLTDNTPPSEIAEAKKWRSTWGEILSGRRHHEFRRRGHRYCQVLRDA